MQRRYQQTPDWSNINPDLLECILKKLPLPAVIRCRSVCSKWRSTTKALLISPPNPPPPVLMLRRKFHNLFAEDDYLGGAESGSDHLFLNLAAPGSYAGSDEDDLAACAPMGHVTDGWMVSTDRSGRLYLLNPSSFGSVICLRHPPIEYPRIPQIYSNYESEWWNNEKVLFWGNPVFGGECSMAILCNYYGHPQRLYFAISKGARVHLGLLSNLDLLYDSGVINDIICVNNRVYGVTPTGYIQAWDCSGNIRNTTTSTKTTATTTKVTVTTYDAPTRTTTVVKTTDTTTNDAPTRTTTTDTTTITTFTTNDAPTLATLDATVVETTDTTTVTTVTTTTTVNTVTTNDAPNLVFSFQPKLDRKCRLADTYLVESEGEVLLVSRNTPDIFMSDPRKKFVVYKLDLGLKRWMAVDSLGDRVLLLLCRRQTMSLSTTEFPNYERNAIYFVVSGTIYIFNMEDGSVKEAGSERMIMGEEIQYFWTSSSMFDLI